ncbi:unnamed protein product [Urochloa humidicola]
MRGGRCRWRRIRRRGGASGHGLGASAGATGRAAGDAGWPAAATAGPHPTTAGRRGRPRPTDGRCGGHGLGASGGGHGVDELEVRQQGRTAAAGFAGVSEARLAAVAAVGSRPSGGVLFSGCCHGRGVVDERSREAEAESLAAIRERRPKGNTGTEPRKLTGGSHLSGRTEIFLTEAMLALLLGKDVHAQPVPLTGKL